MEYFEKRDTGNITYRFASLQPMHDFVTRGLVTTLMDGVMSIVILIMMLYLNPILSLIVLLSTVIYVIVTVLFWAPIRERESEVTKVEADTNSHVFEMITSITSIKLLNAESRLLERWKNLFKLSIHKKIISQKLQIFSESSRQIILVFQEVFILLIGAKMIIDGTYSVGGLIAFISYRLTLRLRVEGLLNSATEFRMLDVHLERLGDILLTPKEDDSSALTQLLPNYDQPGPEITLRNVSFRYSYNDPYILKHVNLNVEAGKLLILTGTSGVGKTTLIKLMLGILRPTEGEVLIDGIPLENIGMKSWRKIVGSVMQQDRISSGSIQENIAFFSSNPDEERVIDCAQKAEIHNEILDMPIGYLSLTGNTGSALSGGQIQRILIARALYSNPSALFLDEVTANLDETSEKKIARVIGAMSTTRVVIAHRPELLKYADQIVEISPEGGILSRSRNAQFQIS